MQKHEISAGNAVLITFRVQTDSIPLDDGWKECLKADPSSAKHIGAKEGEMVYGPPRRFTKLSVDQLFALGYGVRRITLTPDTEKLHMSRLHLRLERNVSISLESWGPIGSYIKKLLSVPYVYVTGLRNPGGPLSIVMKDPMTKKKAQNELSLTVPFTKRGKPEASVSDHETKPAQLTTPTPAQRKRPERIGTLGEALKAAFERR